MADFDALDQKALEWLLSSDEPGVRMQARRDLLDSEAKDEQANVLDGPRVRTLLEGQQPDGSFGDHPYRKWTGAHWRLVSLVELGLPSGEPRALAAFQTVIAWLDRASHRELIPRIDGRYRVCASQEGNALAVAARLGLAADSRVVRLAASLSKWQWPDGGWNCDKRPDARHSSFNESVSPLWGLAEYARATGDKQASEAARRTAQLLLDHGVYKSHRTGDVGNRDWLKLRYPAYWRYSLSQGLLMLGRAGALPDARASDALAVLRDKQQPDGTWQLEGAPFWRRAGPSAREVVDWGSRGERSEMLTLNALRTLREAGQALSRVAGTCS